MLGVVITSPGRTPHAACSQSEVNGVRARSDPDRVLRPAVGGELSLEGRDLVPQDVMAALEHALDGRGDFSADLQELARQVEEGNVHDAYK